MADISLIKIDGKLTKPVTVLLEKIAAATGVLYKPRQIVQTAKAEAKADMIKAGSQIEINDLQRRTFNRFIEEETKRQSNMEDITAKALPHIEEDSSPQDVEDDWVANFFDKCRITSNEDMQELWAKVLADEANSPGTFSRRTVNLLADLDKKDAELFMLLCNFSWTIDGNLTPLIYDYRDTFYMEQGIHYSHLAHLGTLGLIDLNTGLPFIYASIDGKIVVSYHDRHLKLTLPPDAKNELKVGCVLLTNAGHELARICEPKPIDGFFDYVHNIWSGKSLVPKEENR